MPKCYFQKPRVRQWRSGLDSANDGLRTKSLRMPQIEYPNLNKDTENYFQQISVS